MEDGTIAPTMAEDMAEDRNPTPSSDDGFFFSPLAIDEAVIPLPEYKRAGTTSLDLGGLLPPERPLLLLEDLSSGCGGQLWPAGLVLSRHMLRYHTGEEVAEARILELGAGGGLVSLALARGCPDIRWPLLVTDQVDMLSLMEHNINLNGVGDKAKAMILNWGEPLPAEVIDLKPNIILAADCVYFEPAFPLLLATLADLLQLCPPGETVVFFCFKKRRRADMQFLKKAQRRFCVSEVFDEDRPVFSREGLFLYAITSKEKRDS